MVGRLRGPGASVALGVIAALWGCRQLSYPKIREDVPPLAVPGERARSFTVYKVSDDRRVVEKISSDDALGIPLVVIGALPPFGGEIAPWLDIVEKRFAESVKPYRGMLVLEYGDPDVRDLLEALLPARLPFLLDRDGLFPKAFGFVGRDASRQDPVSEGPHVVVISHDGTVRAVIDGPVHPSRVQVLKKALDEVIAEAPPGPAPETSR